jgi:hypothetical protein
VNIGWYWVYLTIGKHQVILSVSHHRQTSGGIKCTSQYHPMFTYGEVHSIPPDVHLWWGTLNITRCLPVVLSAPHQRQPSGGSSNAIILKLLSSLAVSTRLQYCGTLPLLAVFPMLLYCCDSPYKCFLQCCHIELGGPPDEENKLNMTALEDLLMRRISSIWQHWRTSWLGE